MDRRSFLRSLAALPVLAFLGAQRAGAAPKRTKDSAVTWYGWGANIRGCAGLGDTSTHTAGPVAQPAAIEFTQMSASGPHWAAIDGIGQLWVGGENQYFRLGTGDPEFTVRSSPTLISQVIVHDIVEVACTFRGTFARRNDGHILYAGTNAQGENGEGAGAVGSTYTTFTDLTNWSTHAVTRMFGGGSAIAMLLSNGQLWYSGANGSGEAADGTTTDVNTPQQWGGYSDVVDASEPGGAILVLRGNGEIRGAGGNFRGELMDGTTTERHTPTLCTTAPANPASVYMAGETSFVIDASGNVWAAGDNFDSQITNSGVGDGSAHTSAVQILITGKTFKSVLQSRAVDNYALLTTGGELWALGINTVVNGSPIDGSGLNKFAYTRVWSIANVVEAHSPGASEEVFLARVQLPRHGRAWAAVIG